MTRRKPEPPRDDYGPVVLTPTLRDEVERARAMLRPSGHASSSRSPERAVALVQALRQGRSRRFACRAAMISPQTLYAWMEDDPALAHLVEEAEAAFEISLLSTIESSSHLEWQAAAWILERRFPKEWSRKDRIEVQRVDVDGMIAEIASDAGVDPAEVRAEYEKLVEARKAQEARLVGES